MDCICRCSTPLGTVTLASDGEALTGLWFDGQRYYARGLAPGAPEAALPVFDLARRWLEVYFSGREPDFSVTLALRGTPFQLRVWDLLRHIPYGQTATYARIAAAAGSSPRAVGGAVSRNPVSLMVPCHRVVGSDSSLTGYAGGTDRKLALLALEGVTEPGKQRLL